MRGLLHPLNIGGLIADVPIIQGGMGIGISLSKLAAAVANEGGIGIIASAGVGMNETDFNTKYIAANDRALVNEIRNARSLTKGVIGVNIMVAQSNYKEAVKVCIEEGADIIFSGAGLPLHLPKFALVNNTKTKLVPIVSSAKAAYILSNYWLKHYNYLPDAFVVEGPKAGGHLGFKVDQLTDENFSLEKIVVQVINILKPIEEANNKKIPVIAGGGIYTGQDIKKFFELGVSGVQMATRFVTTHECDASDKFKQTYLSATKEDIQIIDSPVGMPGRAIKNTFLDDVISKKKKPFNCPYHCIITCDYKNVSYCIAKALMNAKKGDLENGFAFSGANVYRNNKITSVKEVFDSLKEEYLEK